MIFNKLENSPTYKLDTCHKKCRNRCKLFLTGKLWVDASSYYAKLSEESRKLLELVLIFQTQVPHTW